MNFKQGMQIDISDIVGAGYSSMGSSCYTPQGRRLPEREYCPCCGREKEMYNYMNDRGKVITICSLDHVVEC